MLGTEENSLRALHESLAPVYLVTGVLVPLILQNVWAAGSGFFWLSAGALTIWKPGIYRNTNRKDPVRRVQSDFGARRLVWSKEFECGNSYIDEQHQKLFKGFNALFDALRYNQEKQDIDLLIDTLIGEVKSHFRSEEALLAAWNHPLTEKHKALHESILDKATRLRDESRGSRLSYQRILDFLITDIVYGHIDLEDRKFFHQI